MEIVTNPQCLTIIMEYSRLPNYVGRKENNPFSSKEDNWIIRDKWNDIALCYRSLKHNFDGTYGGKVYKDFNPDILFEKLEIEPDWDKINYYILLDELF
jgi:aminoglycoside phosphotransferase